MEQIVVSTWRDAQIAVSFKGQFTSILEYGIFCFINIASLSPVYLE